MSLHLIKFIISVHIYRQVLVVTATSAKIVQCDTQKCYTKIRRRPTIETCDPAVMQGVFYQYIYLCHIEPYVTEVLNYICMLCLSSY